MTVVFKNPSQQPLAKTHVAKITKDALQRAEKMNSSRNLELPLNKSTTAIYRFHAAKGTININVDQVLKK
jgi:hypothetical protein